MAMSSIHLPTNQQTQKTPNTSQPKTPFRSQPTARNTVGQASSSSHRATQKGTCFRYDQKGSCANTKCRYKHTCTICGKGHSRLRCFSKPAVNENEVVKDVAHKM